MFRKTIIAAVFLAMAATLGSAAEDGGSEWFDVDRQGNVFGQDPVFMGQNNQGMQNMGMGQIPGMGMPNMGGMGQTPNMGMPYPGGGMGGGLAPNMGMQGMPGMGGMGGMGQMPNMGMPYPGGGMGGGLAPNMGMQGMPGMGGIGGMPGMGGIGMEQMPNFTGRYAGYIVLGGRQFTVQLMLQQQGAQLGGQVAINEFGGQPMPIIQGMIQNSTLGIMFSGTGPNGMVGMILSLMPTPNGLQGIAGDATGSQYGQAMFQRIQ